MLWREPDFLWLLIAIAAVGAFVFLAPSRRAALLQRFAEAPLVARLTPDVDRRRRATRRALRVAALACLVFALAGPKWGFHWEEVRREGIDLMVAIDTSRSMLATDVKPNRLERAKLAVLDLVKLMPGDRLGLVPFAGTAFLECPLTLDRAAFERSLRAIDIGIIPRGGTSLARAIDTSLAGFEARQGKHEALILITDGEDHEGDAEEAATRAAERGVRIYAVGIGTSEGELIPLTEGGQRGFLKDRQGQVVKSRLNEDTLQKIALATGGAYVRGTGAALGLDDLFRDHIATMERREVASTLERRYEERFQIPLALALLALVVELVVAERRRQPVAKRRWRLLRRRSDRQQERPEGEARPIAAVSPSPRLPVWVLAILALPLVAWFDPPGDRAAEGNRLYDAGKYEQAAEKYGEGLVDAPESPLLQFNLSTALYKQEKYAEAIAALNKVAATGQAEWVARAAYNLGNSNYQLGANAEEKDPQAAIASYEQALLAYKRAMAADPRDDAPKLNHEIVARRLADVKKKLEEQQKEQQQQQEQQEKTQNQDEQQQSEKQEGQQGQDEQEQEQSQPDEQEQQQAGGEQQQEQAAQEQGSESAPGGAGEQGQDQAAEEGRAGAAEDVSGEPAQDEQAAQAVLDTAQGEELGPEDVKRPVGVAGVGEAAQDW